MGGANYVIVRTLVNLALMSGIAEIIYRLILEVRLCLLVIQLR